MRARRSVVSRADECVGCKFGVAATLPFFDDDDLSARIPGRNPAIWSMPSSPKVNNAVESASVSVADAKTTAESTALAAGCPVRGSMI